MHDAWAFSIKIYEVLNTIFTIIYSMEIMCVYINQSPNDLDRENGLFSSINSERDRCFLLMDVRKGRCDAVINQNTFLIKKKFY